MKREELIKKVELAANTEETATAIYLKHLKNITTRLEAKKEFLDQAGEIINRLIEGNKAHKRRCDEMIARLKKEAKDDI